MRIAKQKRQEIIKDFCSRNNGLYDPASFVREVGAGGPDHPAYEWFTWDDDEAANQHRIWEARKFATGLRIVYSVETIGRQGQVTITEEIAPLVISPAAIRREGGGYYLFDPDDPEHIEELCHQAATDLESWLERYGAAVSHVKGQRGRIEKLILDLQNASNRLTGQGTA